MNDRRRHPTHPRDRCLIAPTHTAHMDGWVAYGMSQQLPTNACADMRAGYSEHREAAIAALLGMEDQP